MKTLSKKELKQLIKDNRESTISLLVENNFTPTPTTQYIGVGVNGVKLEYHNSGCFRAGYGSGKDNIEKIGLAISEEYSDYLVEVKKTMVDVYGMYTAEDFVNFCNFISEIEDLEIKSPYGDSKKKEFGVSFEGTVFENLKERGATMSPMFCNLVCDASGMKLLNIQSEFHTKENGEIDGVEFCQESKKPITIYECQSGIHNGNFLDDNHLNKALGKYIYTPEILPTLKKVVILAGGYSENHLNIIRERSNELLKREQPIEVVLLKTNKVDKNLVVEVVNY
jgi:hypothetical protein